MKSKLLFLSSYASHFIIDDLEILKKHFQVEKLILAGKSRSGFQKLCNTIEIFFAVLRNELVFCWFADFSSFLAVLFSKILNKKSIVMVGGYETSNLPNYGGMQSRSAKYIKYSLKNADSVITVSEFIAEEIIELKLHPDPQIIHLAIDSKENNMLKKKIIVTSGSVTSNLYKIKGIDIFAEATKELNFYQKIVVGEIDTNIKDQLLKKNPNLEFMGKIAHTDFLDLLSETEIYCQFSRRESFGMALLEAINSNCKVVISDRGALPEVAEEKAFIADISDLRNCRSAIAKAIEAKIPDNHDWIKNNFSFKKREIELLKILSDLT